MTGSEPLFLINQSKSALSISFCRLIGGSLNAGNVDLATDAETLHSLTMKRIVLTSFIFGGLLIWS